ncbi:MAG: DUF6920 family protein [Candidatus Izemoplasmataceae bacterium]
MKAWLSDYWWMVLIGMVCVLALAFMIGSIRMNRMIARETETLVSQRDATERETPDTIKEEDLEPLPAPVQRWLENAGVVGHDAIRMMELRQVGTMRLEPEKEKWMASTAYQTINVKDPGFIWHVDLPMIPLLSTRGRDLFWDGEAAMTIRIGALVPVVNEKDNAILNESALHRFLLEVPWYPTAALEDYMTWEAIDETSAKAVLTHKGMRVEAIFTFDDEGLVKTVEADRYKDSDVDAERLPCIGTIKAHTTVDGVKVPSAIEITWMLEEGPFTWYRFESEAMRFLDG